MLGIEELKEKREELGRTITIEEEEKEKVLGELRLLNERLARTDENLKKKYASKAEYDRTIKETESAYMKVRYVSWLNYIHLIISNNL